MYDAAGWEAWSYDSRGHVIAERRNTNSVTKSTAYTYNFHGRVTSITYPSGRVVNYTYNAAGQTTSAADTAHSITYASNAAYNPAGALTSLQEGANLVSTIYYNNRLQPCRISVKNTGSAPSSCADTTTGSVMDFTYGFNYGAADNGNVQSIANNISTGRSQSYTYDELNRVSTAKTTATSGTYSWGLQFGYDPWANLLSTTVTQGCPSPKFKTAWIARGERFFVRFGRVRMLVGYWKELSFCGSRQRTPCGKSNSMMVLSCAVVTVVQTAES